MSSPGIRDTNTTATAAANVGATWSSSVEQIAAANMERCAQMQECQEQMRFWKHKWQTLKAQHKQAALTATLQANPQSWLQLPKKEKWKKSTVLTMLQMHQVASATPAVAASEDSAHVAAAEGIDRYTALPGPLSESSFSQAAPASLVHDRDVFLARISTKQSQRYYSHKNRRRKVLVIPEPLRADTLLLARVLELHPYVLIPCATGSTEDCQGEVDKVQASSFFPDTIWEDVELYSAFSKGVRQYCSKLGEASVLSTDFKETFCRFSCSLRNDAALILQLVQPLSSDLLFDFAEVFLKSSFWKAAENGFQGNMLRDNKKFALQVIEMATTLPDRALKAFSKRLSNDDDLVLAVVKKNGMCLQNATYRLRRQWQIVVTACDSNPQALIYCLRASQSRNRLMLDRKRVLDFFHRLQGEKVIFNSVAATVDLLSFTRKTAAMDRRLWLDLKPHLKQDRDIALAAMLSGCIAVSDLPRNLLNHRRFWKSAIATCPNAWYALPGHLMDDMEFARSIDHFPDERMAFALFAKFPQLLDDRDVWGKILSSSSFLGLPDLLMGIAPSFVFSDKDIVLQALLRDHEILALVSSPLTEDRDVIEAALQCSTQALFGINDFVQMMYPDLVAGAIKSYESDDIWELYDCIDDDLWSDHRVAHAWLARGGDYLHEEFSEDLENDKHAFLLIAEHNPGDFWCASEELCNDHEFMLQVVEKNATLLRESSAQLAHDFEMALVAFGGSSAKSRDLAGLYDINDRDDIQFITEFAKEVREKVRSHENFVKRILCGMSTGKSVTICRLPLLDQGQETSLAYKKLLAEYLGIPIGKELRLLRRASLNLAKWGY